MVPSRLQVGSSLSVTITGIAGSGAANQVAFFSDATTITGSANLTFDGTTFIAATATQLGASITASTANNIYGITTVRRDLNGRFRFFVRNDDAGASATSEIGFQTDAGDVNIIANSLAAGASVAISVDSTYSGGFLISQAGNRSISLFTNGTAGIVLSGAGTVTLGRTSATSFVDVNGRGINVAYNNNAVGYFQLVNANTNSAAGAAMYLSVGGTGAGDPYINLVVSGGSQWSFGLDNDGGDQFSITQAATVGGANEFFSITTAGQVVLQKSGTAANLAINTPAGTPGSDVMTMTNGPAGSVGNPASFMKIVHNGSTYVCPLWNFT